MIPARVRRSRSLAVTGAVIRFPPAHGTPVAAVWVSAERQMAALARACAHWHLTNHNRYRRMMGREHDGLQTRWGTQRHGI
jgi:hypothetical protein